LEQEGRKFSNKILCVTFVQQVPQRRSVPLDKVCNGTDGAV